MKATLILLICFALYSLASDCPFTTSCVPAGQECVSLQTCQRYVDTYTACKDALNTSNPDYNTQSCTCLNTLLTSLYAKEYCRPYFSYSAFCATITNCTCAAAPNATTYNYAGCAAGYYCDFAQGASVPTCLAKRSTGNCSSTNPAVCGSTDTLLDVTRGYSCSYENGVNTTVCKANAYGRDKDQCTVNGNCFSGTCTAGVCVGKTVNTNCAFTGECAYGLYCGAAGTCVAQVVAGGVCSKIYSEQCTLGHVCGGGNVCVPNFSKALGLTCADGSECTPGLACISNKCATPPASPVACNLSTTDCDIYVNGVCSCDGTRLTSTCAINQQSIKVSADCVTAYNAAVTCLTTNACSTVDFTSTSCGTQKCSKEQDCVFKCFTEVVGGNAACYNWQARTCDIPGLTGTPDSAALLTVSSLILFVMSLFF